jgi:aminoglycoside phosphotransferase (APT) family kinase protein
MGGTGELDDLVRPLAPHLPTPDRPAAPERLVDLPDRLVLRVGGSIVRVARDALARERQATVSRLLPLLAGRLPVAVPGPLTLVEPGDALPFGAIVHPSLPGRAMQPGDDRTWPSLAGDLAHLLAGIHGTPVVRASSSGVPIWDVEERMPALEAATAGILADRLDAQELATFTQRWARSFDVLTTLHPAEPVLCHGDPWYENLLIDDRAGRIVGLLDFERVTIADAALDLAAVFHMGSAFADAVVDGYQERRGRDATFAARVMAHRLIREVAGLADAASGTPSDVDEQLDKIRALLSVA